MLERRWAVAVVGSLLINSLALAWIVGGLSTSEEQEPIYMEVTLAELFSPAESGNRQQSPEDSRPVATLPRREPAPMRESQNTVATQTYSGPTQDSVASPAREPAASGGNGQQVAVAGGTSRGPRVVYSAEPGYPEKARRNGWQGTARLRILISPQGQVDDVRVATSSGYAELDQAAVEAVRSWRFSPALQNDRPVAVWVTLPVVFNLK